MRLRGRIRPTVARLVRWLGPRAEDPRTAAIAVGIPATVFSFLYYGHMALGELEWVMVGRYGPVLELVGLFVLTVANACAVSWLVWSRLDPQGVWSYRYGGFGGLLIGLLSHLTLGPVVVVFVEVAGTEPMAFGVTETVGASLIVAAGSVLFTGGIPILLSVGAALLLTYSRRRGDIGCESPGV